MLKYTPYERFLDLAVTYRWAAYRNHDGMASALVRNKELLLWGVTKEQMMKDAKENTEKIFPPVMRKIQSVIPVKITDMEIPLFVLSNGDYMNGASVMLYKDPLRDFANYMGHDLYILPSSIHEVILLLDDEYVQSSEELREWLERQTVWLWIRKKFYQITYIITTERKMRLELPSNNL